MRVLLLDMPKYMGRKDVKRPSWFAVDVDFLTRREHFKQITPAVLMAHIYIVAECFKSESAEIELASAHVEASCNMNLEEFSDACGVLQRLQLIQLVPVDVRARAHTCSTRQDRHNITTAHVNVHAREREPLQEQLTYEPLEEMQQRKKKERKPKQELPCDVIPAFEGIREILENRKVTTLLQEKWAKAYPPQMIFNAVRAADSWATAKGREQKNWGLFFNNWLQREFKGNRFETKGPAASAQEPKPQRKSWFARQLEAEQNGGDA